MLDIGFSELLLIAVVALIVIGPKDLPVVIRHVMKLLRELRGVYAGIKKQMTDVLEESGLDDIRENITTTIIDLEGKPQKAYDVKELASLSAPKIPSPIGGRLGGGREDTDALPNNVPTPALPLQGRE